jgi:hypothetical protein
LSPEFWNILIIIVICSTLTVRWCVTFAHFFCCCCLVVSFFFDPSSIFYLEYSYLYRWGFTYSTIPWRQRPYFRIEVGKGLGPLRSSGSRLATLNVLQQWFLQERNQFLSQISKCYLFLVINYSHLPESELMQGMRGSKN